MNRTVLHIDLDTFYVSCSRLQHPELIGRPVIVGGTRERGVVASCSYEARQFGVHSAMPMFLALQKCPQAKVIRGDMDYYSRKSHEVAQIVEEAAPVMEKASIDEFYLDTTGLDRFFGTWKWSEELAAKITKESGLPISIGLSVNKTVAKIATGEGKAHNAEKRGEGRKLVLQKDVQPFLFPLPVRKIPMVGSETYQTLSRIGIRKIQTLAETPHEYLVSLFGKNGSALWKKANGIDNTPVERYNERKSISKERTFDSDTMDIPRLTDLIGRMVEELGYDLRKSTQLCSTVEVKIKYNDFNVFTKQQRIPYTSCDHSILKVAKELFDKVYDRRMMLRLVGVKLSGLVHGNYQIDAFEDTRELISLYQRIDHIRRRFGEDKIFRANAFDIRS